MITQNGFEFIGIYLALSVGFSEPQPGQENTLHAPRELLKPLTVENNKHASLWTFIGVRHTQHLSPC